MTKKITTSKAAEMLGISETSVTTLEKQGLLHPKKTKSGMLVYSALEIAQIRAHHGPTLSEEAVVIEQGIQREMSASVAFTRKAVKLALGALAIYVLIMAILTASFIVMPLQTAQWLGIIKTKPNAYLTQESYTQQVLGAQTSIGQESAVSLQTALKPMGKVSLEIVRALSPDAYEQVASVAILDTNDVLVLDTSGAITPARPIKLPESKFLQIGSDDLVANLNVQYVQGKQPGTNPGDIAIIGSIPTTSEGPPPLSDITIATAKPLSGGGLVALGETITITCPTCITDKASDGSAQGDISIDSNGDLLLVDIGTAGTYGSDSKIPVITTDAQGRITAVINTAILGLTSTNLSATAGITNEQLTNSSFDFVGNTGSITAPLGSNVTLTGTGITTITGSGTTLTIRSNEEDTLQSVVTRNNIIKTAHGNGIYVDSSDEEIEDTVNGIRIDPPSTIPRHGIYNSLNLGTSTSDTANSYDQATIAVGNIASTDKQNFATLNITNGGTGFLDMELLHGFINFQGMNTLYDDFTGRTLNTANKWTSTSTGAASSCAILAGGLNGLLRMHSGGGANRGCELTTQVIGTLTNGYYQRNNNPIIETRLKIDTATNARIFAGFTGTRVATTAETNPNTHHAYIVKRAADTTWQCITDDGGAIETITDTRVRIEANTFYRLRVELRNGTVPQTICTVDDGTTVTRTVVTATQPGTTKAMDVYIKLNQSDAVIKNMDVDYVRAWQDDPPPLALNSEGSLTPTDAEPILEEEEIPTDTLSENLAVLEKTIVDTIFEKLVEFWHAVIFHTDVTFLGRPTFNSDTAGHAIIKADTDEVIIIFDKAYTKKPVVTASINLTNNDDNSEIPAYAIYGLTTKGFSVKLAKTATSDLDFSWVALSSQGNDEAIELRLSDHKSNTPDIAIETVSQPTNSANIPTTTEEAALDTIITESMETTESVEATESAEATEPAETTESSASTE